MSFRLAIPFALTLRSIKIKAMTHRLKQCQHKSRLPHFLALFLGVVISGSLGAAGVPFQTGDVFVSIGGGNISHYSKAGNLLDTLHTGGSEMEDAGMAFDSSGNLYVAGFNAQAVYKFSPTGSLLGTFGSGYNMDPESIVFDQAGNAYVGQADFNQTQCSQQPPNCTAQILKFSATGTRLAVYSPQVEDRGTDWVDLADQCTLRYTSEGGSIKQLNVCSGAQLPNFASGLSSPCYAHRMRPNFEELVACAGLVYRLNSLGGVVQTYQLPGTSLLFALNLDPDNKSFWTADYLNGAVFRVDIATGNVLTQFNAGHQVSGLAVVGEITAATNVPAPAPTISYYIRTNDAKTLYDQGVLLAQSQIATGTAQENTVALLFGAPAYDSAQQVYGATLWKRRHKGTVSDISSLVQAFITGYYNNLGNHTNLHVRLILATSNSGKNVTSGHGQAWAQMVNSIASWVIRQGYVAQVDIAGGANIELGFNTFAATRNWVNGYASVTPNRFLYNLGAAEGCPPNGSCNNGWTQDNLWFVSWGAVPSLPLPEIYNTANANQWQSLSLYGVQQYNQNVIISGALTEQGACAQNPDSTCQSTVFTPAQGWQSLYNTLNGDTRTAQTLPWSTDIRWLDTKKQ